MKIVAFWLSCWAIGLSFRIILEYLLGYPIYTTNLFDICFDWGILFVLGVINLIKEVKSWIEQLK